MGIRHVAEQAGVSTSTVSEVLSGVGRYTSDTVERVKSAAKRLGYRPSRRARAMQAGWNHCLTLIADIPANQDSPYQAMILAGAALEAKRAGYSVELVETLERTDVREFLRDTDGILVSGFVREEILDCATRYRVPLLRVNPGRCGPVDCVGPDDAAGATAVGRLIRERGYQRVVFLGDPRGRHASAEIRFRAVKAAVKGLEFRPTKGTPAEVEALLKDVGANGRSPTVFVGYADGGLATLILAGTRLGLTCPRDFGLASCHVREEDLFGEMGVDVCGARHSIMAMGQAAGKMMIAKLQNGNRPSPTVIIPEVLHEGNSLRQVVGRVSLPAGRQATRRERGRRLGESAYQRRGV